MLITGSRLVVSDNSGAKEVQCIKAKGKYASIGDIITCSIKKAGKGKVEQVCAQIVEFTLFPSLVTYFISGLFSNKLYPDSVLTDYSLATLPFSGPSC